MITTTTIKKLIMYPLYKRHIICFWHLNENVSFYIITYWYRVDIHELYFRRHDIDQKGVRKSVFFYQSYSYYDKTLRAKFNFVKMI